MNLKDFIQDLHKLNPDGKLPIQLRLLEDDYAFDVVDITPLKEEENFIGEPCIVVTSHTGIHYEEDGFYSERNSCTTVEQLLEQLEQLDGKDDYEIEFRHPDVPATEEFNDVIVAIAIEIDKYADGEPLTLVIRVQDADEE